MFTVLIVDDEPCICDLVRKLVDWEEMGLVYVGEADNGYMAIEKIKELKPDIVLTDIRMPGFNGLEMVRRAKDEFPEMFFVIFSGHKDFDYACSAIKYGVEDYLLKPINQKKLNRVLARITGKLSQKAEKAQQKVIKEEQLEFSLERLKAMFVRHILEEKREIESIEVFNRECQCHYRGSHIQILAVKLDVVSWRYPQKNPVGEKRFIVDKIGDEALDFMEKKGVYAEKFVNGEILYLVIEMQGETDYPELYKMLFREVNTFMERYLPYSVSMGIGAEAKAPDKYTYAFKTARTTVYSRIKTGTDKLLVCQEDADVEIDSLNQVGSFLGEFSQIMETCNEIELQAWLEETVEAILHREKGAYGLLAVLKKYLEQVLFFFHEKSEGELQLSAEKIKTYGDAVFEYTNESWMVRFVKNTILEYFEKYLYYKKMQAARPVREAKKYIDIHFQEDITLERLAEEVYLNPVYLSTMFKNEEGMNYSKYLLKVRIEKAKEMLGNKAYTIAQVAELVGYKDYKHFSKIFKKNVGITPNEFRKLNY